MEKTLLQLISDLRRAAKDDAAGLLTDGDYAMVVLEAIVKYETT